MFAVFEKEIKSLFRSIKNIIIAIVFAVFVGFCFVLGNLSNASADVGILFSNCMFGVLLIPPIAIDLFAHQRKGESDTYLLSLPLTKLQTVLGKYFALLTFFMLPVGIVLVCAIVIGSISLSLFIKFFALVLIFAFVCAFCMMISSLAKQVWSALVISYSAIVVTFIFGLIAILFVGWPLVGVIFAAVLFAAFGVLVYILSKNLICAGIVLAFGIIVCGGGYLFFPSIFEDTLRNVLVFISPFKRYDTFMYELFDISSVLFYVLGTVAFIWITALWLGRRQKDKADKKSIVNVKAKIAMLLVIIICFGPCVTVYAFPNSIRNIDMSEDKIYEISDTTKTYLSSIEENITIYALNYGLMDESVRNYIKRYDELSDKITVKNINVFETQSVAEKYGITVNAQSQFVGFVVEGENRYNIMSYDDLFYCKHAEFGSMTVSSYMGYLQQAMQMYQDSVKNGNSEAAAQYQDILISLQNETDTYFSPEQPMYSILEHVMGYDTYRITGHGEKNSIDTAITLRSYMTGASPTYSKELSLSGITELPKNAGLVIIDSPSSDYSAAEIALLEKYLDADGRVMVMTNAATVSMPNLMKLMARYGLSAKENVSGKVVAKANTSSAPELALKNATSISIVAKEGTTVKALLSEKQAEGQNKDAAKTFAAVAYVSESPRFVWLTGSDTFHPADLSALTNDEKNEYLLAINLIITLSDDTAGIKKGKVSSLKFNVDKNFTGDFITVEEGAITFWAILFILVIPACVGAVPFVCYYTRKKKNKRLSEEN